MGRKIKDLTGATFGRLTVVEYAGKRNGIHHWKCVCNCGNEVIVSQDHLRAGLTKSCGCLRAVIYKDNLKLVAGTSVTKLESRVGKLNANNTSGYNGVYLQKKTGRWVAQIGFRGKKYNLGSFVNKDDAIAARKNAEKKMYHKFLEWYYDEYLPKQKEETEGENLKSDE